MLIEHALQIWMTQNSYKPHRYTFNFHDQRLILCYELHINNTFTHFGKQKQAVDHASLACIPDRIDSKVIQTAQEHFQLPCSMPHLCYDPHINNTFSHYEKQKQAFSHAYWACIPNLNDSKVKQTAQQHFHHPCSITHLCYEPFINDTLFHFHKQKQSVNHASWACIPDQIDSKVI